MAQSNILHSSPRDTFDDRYGKEIYIPNVIDSQEFNVEIVFNLYKLHLGTVFNSYVNPATEKTTNA